MRDRIILDLLFKIIKAETLKAVKAKDEIGRQQFAFELLDLIENLKEISCER